MWETQGRIPPQSPDAEKVLLGALLLERDKLDEVTALIKTPKVFYVPAHQTIYDAMLEMKRTGQPVDLVTVTVHLEKKGELERIGGAYYITNLTMDVVSSAHATAYALQIQEKHIRRELIRISSEVIKRAYDETNDVLEVYNDINKQLAETIQVTSIDDWKSVSDAAVELTKHMESVKGKKVVGVTTGFPKLDNANGGFANGGVYIIAARPAVGKSAAMGNMVVRAAKQGNVCGVISLEMPAKNVFGRMVSSESGSSFLDIDLYRLNEDGLRSVLSKMSEMSKLPIYFSDTAKVNILDITNKAHALRKKHGLDILYIDYLQLVEELPSERGNRENAVSKISRGLKYLAMNLNIPIIALCQLNRDLEKRANKRPILADLRESGSIEQDADGVMFLHRPWALGQQTNEQGESTEFYAELIVQKWRNGAPVELELDFEPTTMTFTEKGSTPPSDYYNPRAGINSRNNDNSPF